MRHHPPQRLLGRFCIGGLDGLHAEDALRGGVARGFKAIGLSLTVALLLKALYARVGLHLQVHHHGIEALVSALSEARCTAQLAGQQGGLSGQRAHGSAFATPGHAQLVQRVEVIAVAPVVAQRGEPVPVHEHGLVFGKLAVKDLVLPCDLAAPVPRPFDAVGKPHGRRAVLLHGKAGNRAAEQRQKAGIANQPLQIGQLMYG